MPAKKRKRKSGRLNSRDLDQVMGAGPIDVAREGARPRGEFAPDAPRAHEIGGAPRDDFKPDKPPGEQPFQVPEKAPVKEHEDIDEPRPIDKSWVMTDEEWDRVPTQEPVEGLLENEQRFTLEKRKKLREMSSSIEAFMDYVRKRRPQFEFDPDMSDRLSTARSVAPETYKVVEKTFKDILGNMQQTIIVIEEDLKKHEQQEKMVRQREETQAEDDVIAARGLKKSRRENG